MDIITHSTFDGPGIVGFGRYCMSLPGLSYYDFQGYLRPLAAAEIRP
jgi:hypothetical protein